MAKLPMKILWIWTLAAASIPIAPAQETAPRKKVALVLSGGGARGASHIGILRVFEETGIPIHCIAGTSFGALVGGLYSIGYSTDEIEEILTGQDWNRMFSDAPERRLIPLVERRNSRYQAELSFRGWHPQLPLGIRGGQRMIEALDELTTSRMLSAQYDFDKLPIQFRAVATNLLDGKPYVFSKGSMSEALRASMAIPLLFTPLEKDGALLVDGGLADNLPTDVARDLGATVVIAVDATSPLLRKDEINSFIEVVDQSISLQMERNEQESRKLASIVLQPRLEEFSNTDYDRFAEISKRGEEEAYRRLDEIKALVVGVPPRPSAERPLPSSAIPRIESISFRGLKKVQPEQLYSNIQVHLGEVVDASAIAEDINRLYATRLFESVGYTLEPLPDHRYHLVYIVTESALNSLGAGVRFDNDFKFVVLAEFTARQLFKSPSTAIVSAQFGGIDYDFAALRYVPSSAPFFFIEPRGEIMRLERLDIRDEEFVDRYTDKREGGRLLFGGTLFNQLEIAAGYRSERVRIDEGSEPNRLNGSQVLAGLTFRLNRDTLDFRDFPRSGMALRIQIDKRSRSLGGDLDFSKWEADYRQYFKLSRRSTVQIQAGAGYSRGSVPFYELFYIGGYSFSQLASRQFVGLERDELTARQMGIVGASYHRLLFSRSLSFIRQGYLTGIYNGVFSSIQESSPYNFDLLHGGGIGLHLDTVIGAVRATGGWAEGGRLNFYFSFGPSF